MAEIRDKKKKGNSKGTVFFRTLKYFFKYKGSIALLFVCYVVFALIGIAWPYLSGKMLYDYVLAKDVVCGSNILPTSEDWQSTVVFKNGSDYTFEKKGTFIMTKGVVVEKGATLKIINSTVNY